MHWSNPLTMIGASKMTHRCAHSCTISDILFQLHIHKTYSTVLQVFQKISTTVSRELGSYIENYTNNVRFAAVLLVYL